MRSLEATHNECLDQFIENMKIQIASDLHNEFGIFDIDFSDIDLLILAGDIDVGENGLIWLKEEVKKTPVIYVPGNHEYYRYSYPKLLNKLKEGAKNTNIHILDNGSITIEGITFHGTTLWTNFELYGDPKIAGMEAQLRMNDYRLIRRDPSYSKLRSVDTHIMHYKSLEWLKDSLLKSKTKTNVVVSHHAPSIKSIADKYKSDILSAAFASDLDDFIKETKPNLWVHGHVHDFFDYKVGETRVVCNPRGYPDENVNYRPKFIVEIDA